MKATDYKVLTTPLQQAFIDYYAGPTGRALKLTETGYALRPLKPEIFTWLKDRLADTWEREGHPHFGPEHASAAESANAALVDARWDMAQLDSYREVPSWVNQSDPSYHGLLGQMLDEHQAWAGIPIQPSQFYGPRVYQRHAVLGRHIDIPSTHVISSSITIAADLEEPWPLVLELDSGEPVAIDLPPGHILFYEGSRLPHYRPKPLVGNAYINLYLHYHPAQGRFDESDGTWRLGAV